MSDGEKPVGQRLAHIEAEGGSPPRFLVATALGLAVLLIASGGLNYVVDPRNEFRHEFVEPVVAKDVREKLDAWPGARSSTKTVVLGSSTMRSMSTLEVEARGFGPTFNFAGGGLDLRGADVLARYTTDGSSVEGLVLGLDRLFLVHENSGRQLEEPELAAYLGFEPREEHLPPDRLLSFGYTWDSLRAVWYGAFGPPASTIGYGPRGDLVRASGDPPDVAPNYPDEAARQRAVEAYMADRIDDYASTTILSASWQHIVNISELAAQRNLTLDIVVQPVHPLFHDRLDEAYGPVLMDALLRRLDGLCVREGTHVHDLYDVDAWQGPEAGFRDAIHFGKPTSDRYWDVVASGERDRCA